MANSWFPHWRKPAGPAGGVVAPDETLSAGQTLVMGA